MIVASSMDTMDEQLLSKEVFGLDKKVAEENYGSWMVAEWRKGRGWFFGDERNTGDGITVGDLRLSTLIEENGKEIKGNIRDINDGLSKSVEFMENLDSDGKQVDISRAGESKVKQPKIKNIKQISGPKTTFKVLKPNVGRLGLMQNNKVGLASGLVNSNNNGRLEREKALAFEQIIISNKLHYETHSAIKFIEENKTTTKYDKENLVFFLGNTNTP